MIRKIIFSLAVATSLVSCSDISKDERFIEIDSIEAQRVVLLEDFTGQECVNCPTAHEIIENLVKQYPEVLVPVSIHAGDFAIPATNRRPGLGQPEGEHYNSIYGINEYPKGVVNGNSGNLDPDKWGDAVRKALQLPTSVDIDLSASVSAENATKIAIDCTIKSTANLEGTLQLWVLEDNIIAKQLTPEGMNNEYVHNHVFRSAVNGQDGEPVNLQANTNQPHSYTIEIRNTDKEKWVAENLSIVAFIRQADGGIAQVAKAHVKL